MQTFILALVLLLAGGLLPLLTFGFLRFAKGGSILLTSAGCVLGIISLIPVLSGSGIPLAAHFSWLHIFSLSFTVDALSALFLLPVLIISPLATLYCFHYLTNEDEKLRIGGCCFFFNLLVISMALVVAADNIITFALVWEMMSLSSFFLVLYEYQKEEARKAAYTYLIFTHVGGFFIFAAFGLSFGYTDSLALTAMAGLPESVKLCVFLLGLIGFGSKAGVYPLHIWLPHAHPAAPSHVSALMSGVMIKMGIYGIIRLYSILKPETILVGEIVLVLGCISGILGVVYALGKHDIKRLLAYHSVENIGIILIGCGVGMIGIASDNPVMAGFGFAGGLLHVMNHSIFKSLLFLGAGAVAKQCGTRHIDHLGGLIKSMPATGYSFLVGSISISGLPPFNGFVSEFLIYYGAFHGLMLGGVQFVLITLAILSLAMIGGLAAACFSKVVGVVFLGEPRSESAGRAVEVGWTMTLPMVLLSLLCILIGLFPGPVVELMRLGMTTIVPASPELSADMANVTAGLAFGARIFAGLALLTWIFQRLFIRADTIGRTSTWGCGFTQPTVRMQYTGTSYAGSIVDFFQPFVLVTTRYPGIKRLFPKSVSHHSTVSDRAENTLMEDLIGPLLHGMGKLRWIQHGHIQLYIGYIIITIIVLLLFVR